MVYSATDRRPATWVPVCAMTARRSTARREHFAARSFRDSACNARTTAIATTVNTATVRRPATPPRTRATTPLTSFAVRATGGRWPARPVLPMRSVECAVAEKMRASPALQRVIVLAGPVRLAERVTGQTAFAARQPTRACNAWPTHIATTTNSVPRIAAFSIRAATSPILCNSATTMSFATGPKPATAVRALAGRARRPRAQKRVSGGLLLERFAAPMRTAARDAILVQSFPAMSILIVPASASVAPTRASPVRRGKFAGLGENACEGFAFRAFVGGGAASSLTPACNALLTWPAPPPARTGSSATAMNSATHSINVPLDPISIVRR